ncbi:hypothetical protein DL93DRAFT_639381 [Clavulina sp. PMI_390]|nr:hypothetical protein DL93DRAFT_639381 [Clavulina sp. PMI_390]
MAHLLDHSSMQLKDKNVTSGWERFLSMLVAFGNAVLAFFRSLVPKSDYMPKLFSPSAPTYFTARRRDPATIITNKWAAVDAGANFDEIDDKTALAIAENRATETVSIRSFVEARCPTMKKEYVPTWWLRNGHANTVYCIMGDFTNKDVVNYQRSLLRMPDGGTIGLDFTPPSWERTVDPKMPIIVILHGLSGGSFESYIRDILSTACAPREEGGLGYRACVMNFRGCAGIPLTSAQLYSGCYLDDLRATLLYLRQEYPEAPLLGMGFSLGANLLLKYVEVEGENCRLRSATVLGCPWDLCLNSNQLENRWFYRNVYAKALGGNLVYLLKMHLPTLAKLAPTNATPHIQQILKMRAPTLKDFDHHVTCHMGGRGADFPIASGMDYYRISSGHDQVHRIKIPFLALNASDDPIVAEIPYADIARSTHVVQLVTDFGGHLGWFEGGRQKDERFGRGFHHPPMRWVRKPVLEWLQATGEDLIAEEFDKLGNKSGSESLKPKLRRAVRGDGPAVDREGEWYYEEGRPEVGFKFLVRAKKAVPKPMM